MKKNDLQVSVYRQLIELKKSFIAFLTDSLHLIKTESELAKKSLKVMFWLFFALLMFVLCSWLCCLGMLFSELAAYGVKLSMNFALLALVNGLLAIGVKYLFNHYRKNLRFKETRQLFYLREKDDESTKKAAGNLQNTDQRA